jgi:hypothetical protein
VIPLERAVADGLARLRVSADALRVRPRALTRTQRARILTTRVQNLVPPLQLSPAKPAAGNSSLHFYAAGSVDADPTFDRVIFSPDLHVSLIPAVWVRFDVLADAKTHLVEFNLTLDPGTLKEFRFRLRDMFNKEEEIVVKPQGVTSHTITRSIKPFAGMESLWVALECLNLPAGSGQWIFHEVVVTASS